MAYRRRALLAPLAIALLLLCCDLRRNVWQAGLPLVTTLFTVESLTPRAEILDAWLVREGLRLRFFTDDTPSCRDVLQAAREVRYSEWKLFGVLTAGEARCETRGIGTLDEWKRRQPRRAASAETLAPRAQATFEVIHRDADVVLARGRFPLASAVGWTGGIDTIAVLPIDPHCESALEGGVASMESHAKGDAPLVLLGSDGLCTIEGLIRPSSAPDPTVGAPTSPPAPAGPAARGRFGARRAWPPPGTAERP